MKKIWLSPPHMGGEEQKFVDEAFTSNWIAPLGPNVDGFEEDLKEYLGHEKHIAVLSSGTAALHLGLILLGVGKGDEVICQSMTFSASANPIVYLGAQPVFVDSERETWNMCPRQLEMAIEDRLTRGKKPKAIVAVHLYGVPYQHDAIQLIANKYDIPVIEDAAEALGSSYKNRKCGTLGDLAILSFNGNKIITTSGGGALISRNPETRKRAIYLSTQARDDAAHYQHSEIGYNYRMSNVLAGIGRGQMKVLTSHVNARRRNYNFYREAFSGRPDITLLPDPEESIPNRWLTCILTESYVHREEIRLRLQEQNIESRPLWKPMHLQPVFSEAPAYTNGVSEDLFNRGLCLPSGSALSVEDLERIVLAIDQKKPVKYLLP